MKNDFTNKIIPTILEKEIKTALSYFPSLKDTPLEFRFKKKIKKSTMQAQPKFSTLLQSKSKRSYIIFIKENFVLGDIDTPIVNLPKDVLIGWIGHELGHIMDYETMTIKQLVKFGYKYLFSENHLKEAERTADSYAVKMGMKDYILKTKDFIMNNPDIPITYKERIKSYYLSPEELMALSE